MAPSVLMPVTAVHEDHCTPSCHLQIGPARKGNVVDPESHSPPEEVASDDHLRIGILSFDPGHHP
jgi:hypothetical protein